jgi:ketosteroid isomerase-like protein
MRKCYVFIAGILAVVCMLGTSRLGIPQTAPVTDATASDKAAIEALEQRYIKAFNAKNVDAIMENYAPGSQLFVFDAVPPREYPNWEAYKKDWEGLFAAYPGPLADAISDLSITVAETVAYAHHIETGYFTRKDGSRVDVVVRVTDVFRKLNGKWLIVHEHVSFPVDIDSGKADLVSKP